MDWMTHVRTRWSPTVSVSWRSTVDSRRKARESAGPVDRAPLQARPRAASAATAPATVGPAEVAARSRARRRWPSGRRRSCRGLASTSRQVSPESRAKRHSSVPHAARLRQHHEQRLRRQLARDLERADGELLVAGGVVAVDAGERQRRRWRRRAGVAHGRRARPAATTATDALASRHAQMPPSTIAASSASGITRLKRMSEDEEHLSPILLAMPEGDTIELAARRLAPLAGCALHGRDAAPAPRRTTASRSGSPARGWRASRPAASTCC